MELIGGPSQNLKLPILATAPSGSGSPLKSSRSPGIL